jgi:hypothetical protein
VKNRLPNFTPDSDEPLQFYAHDAALRGTGVYRAASASADGIAAPTLYTQNITDVSSRPFWVNTNIALTPASGVSVTGNYIFMHKNNGNVVRRAISDGAETEYLTSLSEVGLAAVSDTEVYILEKVNSTMYTISLYNNTGKVSEWHGAVYGEREYPGTFDAVRLADGDYIVFQTELGKNARIIKYADTTWSDSELVYPIDVVDDTSSFRLGGVSSINGNLVVVGIITRDNYKVKIYTIGPKHFTHGREWFIDEGQYIDYTLEISGTPYAIHGSPGKMLLVDDELWIFSGDQTLHSAPSTILFGTDREDQKQTIGFVSANMGSDLNRPSRATFQVPYRYQSSLLKAGNILEWYAEVNGTSFKLGTFSIDAVLDTREVGGRDYAVVARSMSGKYLASWNSDSSFDYWSQTKQSSQVVELAEVIRGDGDWEEESETGEDEPTFLRLKAFNLPGVLYTVHRSSRNGAVVGEFRNGASTSPDASTRYGVAIAYYRETPQDAADRLGVDIASDDDCVHHGLLFMVDSSTGETGLYLITNSTPILLASGSAITPGDDWHWLRIDFHEGLVHCSYRTGIAWTDVITHRFVSDVGYDTPWFSEEVGKGALYIENVTDHATSYAFTTKDTVIPVADNSVFPTSDIVMIDKEIIRYDGKTVNRSILDPMTWAPGRTFKNAPDDNGNDLVTKYIFGAPVHTGYHTSHTMYLRTQSFVAPDDYLLTKVRVWAQKIGSPSAMTMIIATDDYDNWGSELPSWAIVATATVSRSDNNEGYLEGNFAKKSLKSGDAYFIALVSTGHNASNHYRLFHQANINKPRHLYRTHDGNNWVTDNSITMTVWVYAMSNQIDGYEIYFDTEDVNTPIEYYNACALAIIEGPGKGQVFDITGYDYTAPYQWVPDSLDPGWESFVGNLAYGSWVNQEMRRVFVAKDPTNVFTTETKAIIVPGLKISQRGIVIDESGLEVIDKTTIVNHGQSICSLYRDAYMDTRNFQYFTGERDWMLEDMIREISGKANLLDLSVEKRLDQSDVGLTAGLDKDTAQANAVSGETAIVNFTVSNWNSGGVGLAVFPAVDSDIEMAAVVVRETDIVYYKGNTPEIVETFPYTTSGEFTISFQSTSFSVWNNGRFICHFMFPESNADQPDFHQGFKIGVITFNVIEYSASWSMLDNRVDNYILDIGQSGYQLIEGLIGEKQIYFVDDADGNLRFFRTHEIVNEGEPLNLHISGSITDSDTDLKTRLRVEGAEIVELADFAALARYGNRFAMIGLREPNNIIEAMREAEFIQADLLRSSTSLPLRGAMDARIEPGDIVEIYYADGIRSILVKSMSVDMSLDRDNVTFDMSLDGVGYA